VLKGGKSTHASAVVWYSRLAVAKRFVIGCESTCDIVRSRIAKANKFGRYDVVAERDDVVVLIYKSTSDSSYSFFITPPSHTSGIPFSHLHVKFVSPNSPIPLETCIEADSSAVTNFRAQSQ
jgi:hypothetical protein